ncbi:hypothetical protein [Streptomyces omiyaensis]|uniref:Lipoprotein n=1 Tax=Streptomyces omiyaensis TaxID=68247 RepID=A0ABW7BLT6_9ACTN|nr:hypothetical protein [Streptomyces omiyaensis]GGY25751.1 hypothetical protein GCM10010363_02600 [Streptomyces omiyaensis]
MSYVRLSRACCAVVAGGIMLAGCSGGGGGEPSGTPPATTTTPAPGTDPPLVAPVPGATPTALGFVPDPARAPKTPAEAARLATTILSGGPGSWGPGYVARTPYLSAEGYWPVLAEGCDWETTAPPATVLHSVTAYMELPASGGRGTVRVTSTVTVHRTEDAADWEMAETLEEALRCPDQLLRDGERISGLMSLGNAYGVGGNYTADDAVNERGKYLKDGVPGEHYYGWSQSRLGQVTVAVSAKGAPGHTESDLATAMAQASVAMLTRAENALEAEQ